MNDRLAWSFGGKVGGPQPLSGKDRAGRLKEIIEARFEERVSLQELARALDLSSFQVLRLFQRYYGATPHQYLVQVRVETAKRLLLGGESIAEIAIEVGFSDQSHMTKHFKKLLGMTPKQFRTAAGARQAEAARNKNSLSLGSSRPSAAA